MASKGLFTWIESLWRIDSIAKVFNDLICVLLCLSAIRRARLLVSCEDGIAR